MNKIQYALLFCLLNIGSVVQASWLERIKEELLPTGKFLEPVFDLEIPFLKSESYLGKVEFKYTGEYRVEMDLYQTEQNKPPRTVPPAEFTLMGKMELIDDDGQMLISDEFTKTVTNINTRIRLSTFDIGNKRLTGDKIFKIQFQEIPPDWGRYFSSSRIYVLRNMKYSILR